jgi:hypothetical protein
LFLLKASFFVRLVRRLVNSLLPSVRARIEDQGIYVGGKRKSKRSGIVALEGVLQKGKHHLNTTILPVLIAKTE